ncbi:VPLPA-CTERM sorting domain-containing protein [Thalassoglobus sp. JC818]|uniref:VPLPA-CTERM sorting domain-containing protein n=1 Tax=Thalassoglobus sp. JC818 TaxID=3232136 RepID=UPI0034580A83
MLRKTFLLLAAICSVGASQATVNADIVIAENVVTGPGSGLAVFTGNSRGQSFTATQSGRLTTIELQVWRSINGTPTDDLNVSLTTLNSSGTPDLSNVLATRTLSAAEIPTTSFSTALVPVDFSSSMVELMANTDYAILLTSLTGTLPDWYLWTSGAGTAYSDGIGFSGNTSFVADTTFDSGFRVNGTAVVPEPASALLMLSGVCGVGLLRRRSRNR